MIERLLCMIGAHGAGMRGDPTPGPRRVCYCARCGRSWRGAYDWERIQ